MATTLRTELTNAGCNVATATIVFQDGVGKNKKGVGVPDVSPTAYNGRSTTGGTDTRLDYRFVHGFTGGANVPKCVAFSSDGLTMYVWYGAEYSTVPGGTTNSGFVAIPITAAQYVAGNLPIPNLSVV